MGDDDNIQVVYDKQCPVCDYYCHKDDVLDSAGELIRVDARRPGVLMDEITSLGFDIDEGMVLKAGDKLYYGSDALHELALLSSRQGAFNRVTYAVFGRRTVSRVATCCSRYCADHA